MGVIELPATLDASISGSPCNRRARLAAHAVTKHHYAEQLQTSWLQDRRATSLGGDRHFTDGTGPHPELASTAPRDGLLQQQPRPNYKCPAPGICWQPWDPARRLSIPSPVRCRRDLARRCDRDVFAWRHFDSRCNGGLLNSLLRACLTRWWQLLMSGEVLKIPFRSLHRETKMPRVR